ncbi:cytochrome C oxidase Cbb3 [Lysinibacillus sphaericus]|uniref:Cytochrome C oxidase Cbb3 n=2 Tax=Lysinibacillus TaxID=400634 RepID=A0A2S0K2R9_LYSSH|nr:MULTISPECIES: menaquinol-cytochrome c reductase cytochrome b/c subunit [Lysinibacillus]AVK97574.1 cytochrome C oxidase Cbb3 [Lysinibacillus sphaericus]MED4545559.1 c-type cytochrome [Lysinibacillus sphaericus]TKI17775.1 cytochrome C oxidase Cbb3 [Lysinibacillus sphaericus]TKI67441.1 cytochrome C oxidase Cbb3 [Lysinibacillus mangiferihumi]SUV16512.1 menaquinol-cytochrome c reductase, cytochrome b/c subunit [Lysinibacillus sphaericus]
MHRGKGMKFVGDSRIKANHRMPNVPKDYSEYPGKTEAFWPNFLLKEWMVGAVFLIGYLLLTVAHPSPLEGPADPTRAYTPLPDWYFLFMYQLLKYSFASGPYNVIGAIVIPGLAFGALLLMPFLDKSPERRPSKRPLPTAFMLLTLAAMFYLTWESVVNHDWEAQKIQGAIVETVEFDKGSEGYQIYAGSACITCHGEGLEGGAGAPTLMNTGLTADEIIDIAHNGTPSGKMPAGLWTGSDEDLQKLAEFIESLKAE